jgi:hypothetical protein
MTALFDSFGPAWRPVVLFATGYGAMAMVTGIVTGNASTVSLPSDPLRWVFAGAAGPALALMLGFNAGTAGRIKLAVTATTVFIAGVALVAVPTLRSQVTGTASQRLQAIADLDLSFVAAFVTGATCLGLLVRRALEGDEAFTRPWASVLGDARWMSMREARSLFPPSGKVVVGEAYEPWKAAALIWCPPTPAPGARVAGTKSSTTTSPGAARTCCSSRALAASKRPAR